MKDIKYQTKEEERMLKGIQKAYNALPNGWVGNQTLSEIAKDKCPEVFPLTLLIYGMPVIIARDIIPFNPGGSLAGFANTISGSFTHPRAKRPCSILINNGIDVCNVGSKAFAGFKESVIVRYKDNTTKIMRVLWTSEIPNRRDVKWAVGGMGLLDNFDPAKEGYCKFTHNGKTYNHSDVLRKTNHTVLGVKDNFCYLIFCKNMSGEQVNAFCRDKMYLDMAVMLDGGTDIPAMNGAEGFAKINIHRQQGYAIQGV